MRKREQRWINMDRRGKDAVRKQTGKRQKKSLMNTEGRLVELGRGILMKEAYITGSIMLVYANTHAFIYQK